MKIILLVQARVNSSRFPNKVLKPINREKLNILDMIYYRLKKTKNLTKILFVIPQNKKNLKLARYLKHKNYPFFAGSEKNVLSRFYEATKNIKPDYIIRVTSDCPFVDPDILNKLVKKIKTNKFDFLSNTNPPTYADGLDLEAFKFIKLEQAFKNAKSQFDKEHVTPYIKRHSLSNYNLFNKKDYSSMRITIDYPEDFRIFQNLLYKSKNNLNISSKNIEKMWDNNKELFLANMKFERNSSKKGLNKNKKLILRANKVIAGENMLFSKKARLYSDNWPSYFTRAKKISIWDSDNIMYKDLSLMGVGTNILGYSNQNINNAVIKSINSSNMSSLNSKEEVELAEKLISLHPWSDQATFTRTGGEANSVAIRIARIAAKSQNVAVCGYHGWHDWYLATNLGKKNSLKNHLMDNLKVLGVPNKLKGTVYSFEYNNINSLKEIIHKNKIGIVKMEVSRDEVSKNNFLRDVKKICKKNNIILIFDECTSGFRMNNGGLHKMYGVEPDLAIFGKALGNGFAINAIIGKKEIMELKNKSFISSTFWSERSGFAAGIATLNLMEKIKSWKIITQNGNYLRSKISEIAKKHSLKVKITGLSSLIKYEILSKNWPIYRKFIINEMLRNRILGTNAIYVSIYHDKNAFRKYFEILDKLFFQIKNFELTKQI